jgi:hypothetical protein
MHLRRTALSKRKASSVVKPKAVVSAESKKRKGETDGLVSAPKKRKGETDGLVSAPKLPKKIKTASASVGLMTRRGYIRGGEVPTVHE